MKLSALLTAAWCSIIARPGPTSATEDDLLARASAQLERLAPYRRIDADRFELPLREPFARVSRAPWDGRLDNKLDGRLDGRLDNKHDDKLDDQQRRGALVFEFLTPDPRKQREAMKRLDENRWLIDLLAEPSYDALMQERIKRADSASGSASIISGVLGGVFGGISSASKSSSAPKEYVGYSEHYGNHVPTYEDKKFDVWDIKKAIFNTLLQAIKAITGGVIALTGVLAKGGGYLVSAKGQIITKTGEAISTLGRDIAASAVVAPPKDYGHSYERPVETYDHDHTYAGPPPGAHAYSPPTSGGYEGHTEYVGPSDDNDNAGLLIVKPVQPVTSVPEERPPSADEAPSNYAEPENNYARPETQHTIKGVVHIAPAADNQPQNQQNYADSYHATKQPSTYDSGESNYPSYPPLSDSGNEGHPEGYNEGHNEQSEPVSNHLHHQYGAPEGQSNGLYLPGTFDVPNVQSSGDTGDTFYASLDLGIGPQVDQFKLGIRPLDPLKVTIGHPNDLNLLKLHPQLNLPVSASFPAQSVLGSPQPLRIPILKPLPADYWRAAGSPATGYLPHGFLRRSTVVRSRRIVRNGRP